VEARVRLGRCCQSPQTAHVGLHDGRGLPA
jgi:hypothetical protein